jgi:hypothetical protein
MPAGDVSCICILDGIIQPPNFYENQKYQIHNGNATIFMYYPQGCYFITIVDIHLIKRTDILGFGCV